MATKHELERKPLFRFTKVLFWISAIIVIGLTVVVWYVIASSGVDASQAYFVCNGQTTQHPLTQSQQNYIQTFHASTFRNAPNDVDNEGVHKTCYQEYSGKNPELATNAEVQDFRSWETGSNGDVYAVQGIHHDWHWSWLIGALVVEYIIFQLLKNLGLYIAGGKEALDE
jgi:hypothetical protein